MSNNNFQWTKDKPTEPGTYAWRESPEDRIDLTLIRIYFKNDVLVAWIQNTTRLVHPVSELADREWLKLPE